MLDRYIVGNVSRISPEAPIPVIEVEKEFNNLGGAANVASNISSLSGNVSLFGFISCDDYSNQLKELLNEKKIDYWFGESSITSQKIRVIGNNQQFVRLDYEDNSNKQFNKTLENRLLEEANNSDMIVISDYAKGTITKNLIDLLKNYKSKLIIDPKPKNSQIYPSALLFTPNEKESFEMSGHIKANRAGIKLKNNLESHILITRGEDGMLLIDGDTLINIPTYAREVYDVSGAGDTVVASLALALASGADLNNSAIIANHAAGIVVGKKGTYSVNVEELKARIYNFSKKD